MFMDVSQGAGLLSGAAALLPSHGVCGAGSGYATRKRMRCP